MQRAMNNGKHIYAEFKGYGRGMDSYHVTAPSPTGDGAITCMKEALKNAKLSCKEIDYICAHGTGTLANDKSESEAIRGIFKGSEIPPVSSIKSVIGHALGAASAIEAVASCMMIEKEKILPTQNFETKDPDCIDDCVPEKPRDKKLNNVMSNAFAFGGNTSSIILSRV